MVSSRTYLNLTPDTYAVAERFNVLLDATPCPYAWGSRVWCGPQWDSQLKFKPESTEGRPLGQPLKKPAGAPLNLG